ncbi:hypothetical protein JHK82_044377 [Glycine max]|nr:hypothetical protein JHK82_044377 [Glycine max]
MWMWPRTLSMAQALCELQLELQNGSPCTIAVSGNSKGETEGFIPKTSASKETRRNKQKVDTMVKLCEVLESLKLKVIMANITSFSDTLLKTVVIKIPPPPSPPLHNHQSQSPNTPLPTKNTQPQNPTLKHHHRSKYHKPVPYNGSVITSDDADRATVILDSSVSYLLHSVPFEFQFSYFETLNLKPVALHQPLFLPFALPTMPQLWIGKAQLKGKKDPHCPTTSTSTSRSPLSSDSVTHFGIGVSHRRSAVLVQLAKAIEADTINNVVGVDKRFRTSGKT